MPIAAGTHDIGSADGSLRVHTYRQGAGARLGHDLIIEVADWQGQAVVADDGSLVSVELSASPASLVVREASGGIRPLTDGDRDSIRAAVEAKVLMGRPIAFRSTAVQANGDGAVEVRGDLSLATSTRPTAISLAIGDDGRARGRVTVRQSDWGIKQYTAFLGSLKVRDEVEVAIDAQLPVR